MGKDSGKDSDFKKFPKVDQKRSLEGFKKPKVKTKAGSQATSHIHDIEVQ